MEIPMKVVKPYGILDDNTSNQFCLEISRLLEENTEFILIDFKDVTFMDSLGLRRLIICLNKVRSAGANLFICSINDQLRILFELTGMNDVFEIFACREEIEHKILTKIS
jgi:anti-anti-sigma factor